MRTNTLMRIQLLLTTLVNCSIKASARAVHSLPPAPDQRKDTAEARAPARGLRCAGADTDRNRHKTVSCAITGQVTSEAEAASFVAYTEEGSSRLAAANSTVPNLNTRRTPRDSTSLGYSMSCTATDPPPANNQQNRTEALVNHKKAVRDAQETGPQRVVARPMCCGP
jgi:hypothetical protein